MSDTPHAFDELDPFDILRREAGDASPTSEQEAGEYEEFRRSLRQPVPSSHTWRVWVTIGVSAFAALTFGVLWFFPSEVEATVGEIAEAARHAADVDLPEGSFVYVRSSESIVTIRPGVEFGLGRDSVAYVRPHVREVWRSPESGFIRIRITASTPEFFDQESKDAYYEEGLDEDDQIGQTRTEQLTGAFDPRLDTDWATDPALLRAQLVQFLEGGAMVDDHALFDVLLDLLGEADPSPQLRGALLDVAAGLEIGIADAGSEHVVLRSTSGDEVIEAILGRDGELNQVRVITVGGDPDLQIPPGTTLSKVHYEVRQIVNEIPPD